MRIGVDATCWHNRRGFGRYGRALLRALIAQDRGNQYTLLLDSAQPAEPLPEGCEIRVLDAGVPTYKAASAAGRRSVADMWRMSRALSSPEFDVLFFPTIYSFVPAFGRARKVVMMHDVIAHIYPQLTVPRLSNRLFWNAKTTVGRWQADSLITCSEYARDCIARHFHMDRERISVVGAATDAVFRPIDKEAALAVLREAGIDSTHRIVVYLGGFSPHKNLEALVAAFSRVTAKPEFADVHLVMVGDNKGDAFLTCFEQISRVAERMGTTDRVIYPGYLSDEVVVALLNVAEVLALPSLMEGFGLPAIEAAACGCPVIATKASPLPEAMPEGGVFIEPCEDEIAQALESVLSSAELRARLRAGGLAAASRLTWEAAAAQMIEVIRRVAPG